MWAHVVDRSRGACPGNSTLRDYVDSAEWCNARSAARLGRLSRGPLRSEQPRPLRSAKALNARAHLPRRVVTLSNAHDALTARCADRLGRRRLALDLLYKYLAVKRAWLLYDVHLIPWARRPPGHLTQSDGRGWLLGAGCKRDAPRLIWKQ